MTSKTKKNIVHRDMKPANVFIREVRVFASSSLLLSSLELSGTKVYQP